MLKHARLTSRKIIAMLLGAVVSSSRGSSVVVFSKPLSEQSTYRTCYFRFIEAPDEGLVEGYNLARDTCG